MNARGFFHFEEVDPGEYVVSAAVKKLVSETPQIRVIAGREAELRDPFGLEGRNGCP